MDNGVVVHIGDVSDILSTHRVSEVSYGRFVHGTSDDLTTRRGVLVCCGRACGGTKLAGLGGTHSRPVCSSLLASHEGHRADEDRFHGFHQFASMVTIRHRTDLRPVDAGSDLADYFVHLDG